MAKGNDIPDVVAANPNGRFEQLALDGEAGGQKLLMTRGPSHSRIPGKEPIRA